MSHFQPGTYCGAIRQLRLAPKQEMEFGVYRQRNFSQLEEQR